VELIHEAAAFRAATDAWRARGSTVGFHPTMGALHAGHVADIRLARTSNDLVAVSIYVNPFQFGPTEDFARYPRPLEADLRLCEREGVDAVWAPPDDEMYPPGVELPEPDPGPVGATFEGAARPGHFAGVLKVVHRLLDVAGPSRTYFGEKDAQQLYLVRRMVERLGLPAEIVACPTVREPDGLAVSSRNAYLSPEEREQATCLFLALGEAAEHARDGERDARVLVALMAREIGATPLARLDYAAVVDEASFEPVDVVGGNARALVAARFASSRLIDNLRLPGPGA
jgi:pantoate--beta-alanine ligase